MSERPRAGPQDFGGEEEGITLSAKAVGLLVFLVVFIVFAAIALVALANGFREVAFLATAVAALVSADKRTLRLLSFRGEVVAFPERESGTGEDGDGGDDGGGGAPGRGVKPTPPGPSPLPLRVVSARGGAAHTSAPLAASDSTHATDESRVGADGGRA